MQNWNTLLAIAGVVLVTLAWKGYLKIPGFTGFSASHSPAHSQPPVSGTTYAEATPHEAYMLEKLDSHTLGTYFALAKRREVEANLAHDVALRAGKDIEALFTAPFSPPAPAGQAPNQAGPTQ